jgi:hypothetical protein
LNFGPVPNPDVAEEANWFGKVRVAAHPIVDELVTFGSEARGDLHGAHELVHVEPSAHVDRP